MSDNGHASESALQREPVVAAEFAGNPPIGVELLRFAEGRGFVPIGDSGLSRFGGVIQEDPLSRLQGIRWYRTVRAMLYSPIVAGMLMAVEMLIRQAEWQIDPAEDGGTEAQEIADFVESCRHDMWTSWPDTLAQVLSFLPYGFCLPGDQMILDGDGRPRPIAKVRVGDRVLTKYGRPREVTRVFERQYTGEMVTLRIAGFPEPIRMTSGHQVPTVDGWKSAGDIKVGDEVLRPRPTLTPDGDYLSGWIVGVFLAEGWQRRDAQNVIKFAVHEDEADELVARLTQWAADRGLVWDHSGRGGRRQAGAKVRFARDTVRGGRGALVTITHAAFRDLIQEWVAPRTDRARPRDKALARLPEQFEFARGVWDGWWWGDGHESLHRQPDGSYRSRREGSTSSRTLAHQLQLIGGALGYPSAMWSDRAGRWNIGGADQTYRTSAWSGETVERMRELVSAGASVADAARSARVPSTTARRWLRGEAPKPVRGQPRVYPEAIGHRVKRVIREPFAGPVFDLTVDEDHTFCAGPMIVSNSLHEIVYKRRLGPGGDQPSAYDDGLISWDEWQPRAQDTVTRWVFNRYGRVEAFEQQAPMMSRAVTIPLSRCLHFRAGGYRGSPEGASVLRPIYADWDAINKIQLIEAIGIERDLAGLPVFRIPSKLMDMNATPENKAAYESYKTMGVSLRQGDQSVVVLPSERNAATGQLDYDLALLSTGGTRQFDTSSVITRRTTQMTMAILADWLMVGHGKTGSFALSQSKTALFTKAISAWLDVIADVINGQGIRPLVRANGIDTRIAPTLRPGNLDDTDLRATGEFVTRLLPLITQLNDEDRIALTTYLFDTADFPAVTTKPKGLKNPEPPVVTPPVKHETVTDPAVEGEAVTTPADVA